MLAITGTALLGANVGKRLASSILWLAAKGLDKRLTVWFNIEERALQMFYELKQSIRCALPTTCIVFEQNADLDYSICNDCGYELPKIGDCSRRCGIELSGGLVMDSCCTSCQLSPPSFDSCTCAFPYVSPIDKLVADFKFSARFDIGYFFSRVFASAFNAY